MFFPMLGKCKFRKHADHVFGICNNDKRSKTIGTFPLLGAEEVPPPFSEVRATTGSTIFNLCIIVTEISRCVLLGFLSSIR